MGDLGPWLGSVKSLLSVLNQSPVSSPFLSLMFEVGFLFIPWLGLLFQGFHFTQSVGLLKGASLIFIMSFLIPYGYPPPEFLASSLSSTILLQLVSPSWFFSVKKKYNTTLATYPQHFLRTLSQCDRLRIFKTPQHFLPIFSPEMPPSY